MAAQIESELGLATQLVAGSPGELSVWIGDAQIIAKQGARFPDPADVVAAIRAHRA